MIIVIALSTISGLLFTDLSMANALRTWRIIFLILSGIAGLIGVCVAILFLIVNIASTSSFTKPFTYPVAPMNLDRIKKEVIKRRNIGKDKCRSKMLTDNLTKSNIN